MARAWLQPKKEKNVTILAKKSYLWLFYTHFVRIELIPSHISLPYFKYNFIDNFHFFFFFLLLLLFVLFVCKWHLMMCIHCMLHRKCNNREKEIERKREREKKRKINNYFMEYFFIILIFFKSNFKKNEKSLFGFCLW